MDKRDWGFEERVWGLEESYDAGRMIPIYLAIKDRNVKSILDVACGVGLIADGLTWMWDDRDIEQFDIIEYPEWRGLKVKPFKKDVMDFIKEDKHYDVVMFLNSYRNWDKKEQFNEWLKRNARYFITSGANLPYKKEIIGKDVKGHNLELYTI